MAEQPEDAAPVTNGRESAEASELEQKIIRQIEYYFGDINFSKDKFLIEEAKKDDGWIPLETMIKFNRLKILTEDFEVIVKALKKSKQQLMEINEDGKKIRRSPSKPLPEFNQERKEELLHRSLYVKGFPPEATIDTLLEFFKPYDVEGIQMRRMINKKFKGSVFATFMTKEGCEKFLQLDTLKYGETDLLRETKEGYLKRKVEERAQFKEEKRKRKEGQEQNKDGDDVKDENAAPDFEKGSVLRMTGCNDKTTREDIRELFEKFGIVGWIDFGRGDTDAWVRFDSPVAQEALDKARKESDGKIIIKGTEVDATVIEGDEEVQYWIAAAKAKEEGKKKKKEFMKGNRGRGRGRGGWRGRGRGRGGWRGGSRGRGRRRDADSDDEGGDDDDGGDMEEESSARGLKRPKEESSDSPQKKVATGDGD
jgi:lupus La protein